MAAAASASGAPRDMNAMRDQAAMMRESIALINNTRKPRFLIDPRTSSRLGIWDLIVGLLLCYTALLTPYEVAFLPLPTTALEPRFIFNRVVDFAFIIDMIIQLLVMYPLPPAAY